MLSSTASSSHTAEDRTPQTQSECKASDYGRQDFHRIQSFYLQHIIQHGRNVPLFASIGRRKACLLIYSNRWSKKVRPVHIFACINALIKPNYKACNCEDIATQRPLRLAPVDLAYCQHFLGFLFENIAVLEVPRGNHKCRSRDATPLINNKLESVQLQKHCISNAERHCARRCGFFGLVWCENIVFGRFAKCA